MRLSAAERGARLTGQLLAFSRVQRLEVRPTFVAPLIQNMRPLLRNVLGPGIEKRFDLDDAMMQVMADPTQLEVAVLNLAINARDAMPEGGVLSFSSRAGHGPHRRGDLAAGDYIELIITDTGAGMPPEIAERAFEPFFTTKEVGKGTGLGLSMVYGMARQSGGTARIESTVGKGTAVSLLFRKAEGAVAEAGQAFDEPAAAPQQAAPLSILVIDDDPDVRGFIAATLEEQGFAVRQAPDGRNGLAQIKREPADLVIIDFIMPGLSGAEVAQRILRRDPGPADPVRVRLQRDRRGQAHRARHPAARQAVPRRSAAQGHSRGGQRQRLNPITTCALCGVGGDWRVTMAFPILFLAAAAAASTNVPVMPAAAQLFERDWVLMNWALKFHDTDRDILLEPGEAAAAADDFRKIADSDGDGRVTPTEYRNARAFILARY